MHKCVVVVVVAAAAAAVVVVVVVVASAAAVVVVVVVVVVVCVCARVCVCVCMRACVCACLACALLVLTGHCCSPCPSASGKLWSGMTACAADVITSYVLCFQATAVPPPRALLLVPQPPPRAVPPPRLPAAVNVQPEVRALVVLMHVTISNASETP